MRKVCSEIINSREERCECHNSHCNVGEKAFFDQVFASIGPVDKNRCLILGDSLTSDMQGGRNAGIKTCYFGTDPDDRCDFSITDLTQFPSILGM